MKQLLSNKLAVNYKEYNESASNTLVFLHGNSHCHKSFAKQIESQLLKNKRLILLDLPGHGESSRIKDYTLPVIAELVAEFIVEKRLKNYAIVGHSLGGHIGIHALNFLSPKGHVIFGTPPLSKPFEPSSFLPCPGMTALLQPESSSEEIDSLMNDLNYYAEDREQAIEAYQKADPNFRATLLGSVAGGKYFDEVDLLRKYKGKLHIILAEGETLVSNSYIKNFLNLGDFSSLKSKHSPQIDQADAFNAILHEFCLKTF